MKRTFTNLGSVVGGEMLLRVANFAALVVMARLYGPETMGNFATALAAATVTFMIAINGLQTSSILEVGRSTDGLAAAVSRVFWSLSMFLGPAALALVAVSFWIAPSSQVCIVAGLVVLRTLIQLYCQVELSILKSLDRMATIGRIQAVHFVVLLAGIGAVYQLRAPVAWLLLVLVGGQLLEFVLSGGVLARAGARLHRVPMRECLGLVKRSTPIGFTHALANIILRLDVLVLSVLASPIEVGQFAVAHALLVMVYVAAWLFGSVLLPQMVRLAESAAESAALVERWTRVVLLVTLPLAALAWWLVPPVLATVFGARFAASGGLAAWLLLASPLVLLNSLHVNHAMARGWTATYLGAHVATAVFALSLNLALGLQFGGPGIAAAVLLRELFLFAVLKWKGARMAVQAAQLAPCTESHD